MWESRAQPFPKMPSLFGARFFLWQRKPIAEVEPTDIPDAARRVGQTGAIETAPLQHSAHAQRSQSAILALPPLSDGHRPHGRHSAALPQLPKLAGLSLMYMPGTLTFFWNFAYLPSGAAAIIHYSLSGHVLHGALFRGRFSPMTTLGILLSPGRRVSAGQRLSKPSGSRTKG